MKKRIISLFVTLILFISLCVPVLAAGFEEAELYFVTDDVGVLSDPEWEQLEQQAEDISVQYQCGVYVILVDDFTNYTYDDTVYEAAKTFYQDYTLGYGTQRDGILLLLSMEDRDYALVADGYGNTAFTDYGKDKLSDVFLDDFKDDDWYGGLSDYLEKCESMLKSARAGNPLDVGSNPMIRIAGIGISLLIGCGLALLLCWLLKERQMKSVAVKAEAGAYLSGGSVNITNRQDQFTHTTQIRTKIEKKSSGGGTSVDKDGFSGKSGKF